MSALPGRTGGPLTDREQLRLAQARIAELEAEVAAWRAGEDEQLRWALAATRVEQVRRAFGRHGDRLGPGAARVLLDLLDHPGQVRTFRQVWVAKVYICELRKVLARAGLTGAVTTSWGVGYFIAPDAAARVTAYLGEAGA